MFGGKWRGDGVGFRFLSVLLLIPPFRPLPPWQTTIRSIRPPSGQNSPQISQKNQAHQPDISSLLAVFLSITHLF